MDYLQTTKGRILASIKRNGHGHPDTLASELGIAATSVRQHLTALQRDGYVAMQEERERPGRPRQVFRVTREGDALFPKRYDAFATEILDAALASGGANHLLSRFVEATVAARKGQVTGFDTRQRMDEVAEVMRDEGGMAGVIEDEHHLVLLEPNCVYASVASKQPAVCEAHTEIVQRLLAVPAVFTRCTDPHRGGCRWAVERPISRNGGQENQ